MNRKLVIVFLVVSMMSPYAYSEGTQDAGVRAEIIELDDAWIRAEVGRDKAALEEILDERFLVTYPSGRTADRATFVDGIMRSDIKPFEVIHEEIRVHGDTVVVVDSTTDGKTRFIWVAVKKGDQWKVISEVAIRVADPK